MKTKLFISLFLMTFVSLSCSVDSLNETIEDTAEMNHLQSKSSEIGSSAIKFKMNGFGTLVQSRPSSCQTKGQIEIEGQTLISGFGTFETRATQCTDFNESNFIKGYHFDNNGNQLFYYSEKSGIDKMGKYYLCIYYGGTGKFKNISAQIKVYSEEFMEGIHGRYRNHGEGVMQFK